MIHIEDLLLRFSVVSLVIYFLRNCLRKAIRMALTSSSSPSSSWLGSFFFQADSSSKRFKTQVFFDHFTQEAEKTLGDDCQIRQGILFDVDKSGKSCNEIIGGSGDQKKNDIILDHEETQGKGMLRKRPAQLIVPAYCPTSDFVREGNKMERKEFQEEGKGFSLASKKGKREVMEDGHAVMLDISGNSKQAFFVVIDGHGGRGAVDFVAENLGRNIMDHEVMKTGGNNNMTGKQQVEAAIRSGFSVTDTQLLRQGVSGGACAASVLIKDGEVHAANVGDCRVVLSRKGVAIALTTDHHLHRQDERARIENAGGYLQCRNGVWRVNGSLAVSRAFGDVHLKDYVISEPDIVSLPLTNDCDFLLLASDGLWNKVGEQEAVDVVSKKRNSLESCRELVDLCSSRGNMDDVTVMVINLQNFVNPTSPH